MLWPVILPLRITLGVMLVFIAISFLLSMCMKWDLVKSIAFSFIIAAIAFLPVCSGVTAYIDSERFGTFEHTVYSEVQDFRIERYLPPASTRITLDKYAMGYRARYAITQTDLTDYLDDMWMEWGEHSAITREELRDGETLGLDKFDYRFDRLDWELPETAIHFHSPIESDGGGSDYFFDPENETVFQHAGYW